MAWAHSRAEVQAKLAPLVETSDEQQLRKFDTDELASALADSGEPAGGVGPRRMRRWARSARHEAALACKL